MEEERKKLLFVFVFSTYLPVFLLKFRLGELDGCGIWFRIQRVPTLHTFDGPRYPKNKKYLKKRDDGVIITFFQVFLDFGVAEIFKIMSSEYSLDAEFDSSSNEYPHYILLIDPATPKTRNTWKNVMMDPATPKTRNTWKNLMMTSSSRFFEYFLFFG